MDYHDDFHLKNQKVTFQLPSHILTNRKVQGYRVFESSENINDTYKQNFSFRYHSTEVHTLLYYFL